MMNDDKSLEPGTGKGTAITLVRLHLKGNRVSMIEMLV
jgi:hypothetical protein